MGIMAWPFLIGCNRFLGYQVVMAPQILVENSLSYLLTQASGGPDSPPLSATFCEIRGTEIGTISVIFRVIRPQAKDYELEGFDLRDKVGRPIRLIEGMVIIGSYREIDDITLTQEDFLFVHQHVKDAYRAFWEATNNFPEWTSQPFELTAKTNVDEQITLKTKTPLETEQVSGVQRSSKRTRTPQESSGNTQDLPPNGKRRRALILTAGSIGVAACSGAGIT